jgi:hypothetical protein
MNYVLLADFLWYSGHVLTGSSVLFSRTNYKLTISLVFVGQFITIISRPIGRITNKIDIIDIKDKPVLV